MKNGSCANEKFISDIVQQLTSFLSEKRDGDTNKNWTNAVWRFFGKFAEDKKWHLYPKPKPYKGEYLVDFILFEENYGPRLACESQWSYWRQRDPEAAIEWAFDKLRGVKADVKLLLYEWGEKPVKGVPDKAIRNILIPYLANNALITDSEAFVFIQYDKDVPYAYWWKPTKSGRHTENEINFKEIVIH